MKKRFKRIGFCLFVCAVIIAVILISLVYFQYISRRIFEDSTRSLDEIYSQVNRSFGAFVERNWGLLESWDDAHIFSEAMEGEAPAFVAREQAHWGFSDFYFLSENGESLSIGGEKVLLNLGNELPTLTEQRQPLMAGTALPSGEAVTVFAVPVSHRTIRGFSCDAIAVAYTNTDLASSLNVDAFSGKARCFVIRDDGQVLLSTQAGGSVFSNYLVYLQAVSDLSEEDLAAMAQDWAAGRQGLVRCEIGGVSHVILYQSLGYLDYLMLSAVPQSAISEGFLSVQKATINVLVVIFLLVGAVAVVLLVLRSNRLSRENRLELQYRERMFDVLSNSVDDIFITLNTADQHVDYISPNIERLLGIPVEEARKDIRVMEKCAVNYDVVIPKDVLESIPLNGNRYWECEYMHQNTGERRWYRMTVYHMSIQEVSKYIIVLSDRTMEQQMNQKLQQALNAAQSANTAKSNFLSNMSHDIRTPMNAIVGFSVLLDKNADQPEKVREYTRKITSSSQHLLSLINDVLDMSKIESGKTSLNVERFSLPEMLEELTIIVMPQARAKQQDFSIHVQGAPPEQIIGDKLRLNQILLNLLSNAVKYTPEGGKIEFTVCPIPGAGQQYARLRFAVKDNGIGMSEEFQATVFEPFSREINSVTNKIQGTGLGMAITKNLVELMGGIIQVESTPGKGSTFTVELSFLLPEQEEVSWYRDKVTRMLVADDEEDICLSIRELMRDSGVDVACVHDGDDAVDLAATAWQRGEGFHVILLDWKMPRMDGVEAARQIRARIGEQVPILVLTSYDWADIETEARQAGIDAFMPKPFFVSTFWDTIRPLFPEGQAAAPAGSAQILEGRRFLAAEDNELNAEILTEMLEMEGASCEVAPNGQEALEMFESSRPGTYDMILMDVQMPVMNGYDAARAIRACGHPQAASIPIVAMTANAFAEDVRNALDAGMNGHLSKPIDMNAVREMVGRLLSRSSAPCVDSEGENL